MASLAAVVAKKNIFVVPRLPISVFEWWIQTTATWWYGALFPLTQLHRIFLVCSNAAFFPTHRRCNSQPSSFCDVGLVCLGPYMDVCRTNNLNQQKHFLEAWKLQHVDNRLSFSFVWKNHTRICFCWKKIKGPKWCWHSLRVPKTSKKRPPRTFLKKQESVLLHSGNISFLASGGLPREPLTAYTGNKYSSLEQRQHMS